MLAFSLVLGEEWNHVIDWKQVLLQNVISYLTAQNPARVQSLN